MKKKLSRALGLLLSFTMMFSETGGVFANAADTDREEISVSSDQSVSEDVSVSVNEKEEEQTASGNEAEPEESIIDNDSDEPAESADDVSDPVYKLLDEGYVKVDKCTVEAGSYNAKVEIAGKIDDSGWEYASWAVIYTASENAAFFPEREYVTVDELEGYYVTGAAVYSKTENTDDGSVFYYDIDLAPEYDRYMALSPDTVYSYQVVSYISGYDLNADDYFYKYYFLTEPQSFTTGKAITSTQVSINEITVEEKGYYKEELSVKLDNPANEKIACVEIAEKSADDLTARVYNTLSYDPDKDVYTGYFSKNEKELELRALVYTGTGEKNYIKKDLVQDFIDDKDLKFSVSFNETSLNIVAEGTLTPYYDVDTIFVGFTYKKTSDESWYSDNVVGLGKDGSFSVYLTQGKALEPDTEYQYYLYFSYAGNAFIKTIGSQESPRSFKTGSIKKYTAADFKDEGIYAYLIEKYGEENMNSGYLEGVEGIVFDYGDIAGKAVRKLDDLPEKLPNLTYLGLHAHYVTDISPLLNMKCLKNVWLQYNDISTLPDLSNIKWTTLNLEQNPVTEADISGANIPFGVDLHWSPRTEALNTADIYYIDAEGIYPMILEYKGKKGRHDYYSANISINGITKTYDQWDGHSITVYTAKEDFGLEAGKTYTARIRINDGFCDVIDEERSFRFGDISEINGDLYTAPVDTEAYYTTYLPFGDYNEDPVTGVQIKKGEKLYFASYYLDVCDTDMTYDLYRDYFSYVYDIQGLNYNSSYVWYYLSMLRVPESGDYDIVVNLSSGKSIVFENRFHVTSEAVVSGIVYRNDRDNSGPYYHIGLLGYNLNEKAVYPVITDAEGTEYTGAVSMTVTGEDSAIYKLEKKDNWDEINKAEDYDTYYIVFKGENFIDSTSTDQKKLEAYNLKEKDFNLRPLKSYYNWKTKTFEFRFDSTIKKDTELEFYFYDNYEKTGRQGYAKAKAGENGLVSVTPLTEDGTVYIPLNDGGSFYQFYEVKCGDELYEDSFSGWFYDWYGYSGSSDPDDEYLYVNTSEEYLYAPAASIEVTVRATAGMHKTDKLYARIADKEEEKELSCKKDDEEDVFESGEWKFSKPLDAGVYCIGVYERVDGEEVLLGETAIYVKDKDKFYASDVYACFSDKDKTKAELYIEMPFVDIPKKRAEIDKLIKKLKLDIKVYDADLNSVTSAKAVPDYAYCMDNVLKFVISGLDAKELAYYVRITADGKTPLDPESDLEIYNDPGHGNLIARRASFVYYSSEALDAVCGFYYHCNITAPYTLNFYLIHDTDTAVKTITVKESDFDKNGYYAFTKKDVDGLDVNTVYILEVISADHQVHYYTGYITSVENGAVYNPQKVAVRVNKKDFIYAALTLDTKGADPVSAFYTIAKNGKSAKMTKLTKRGYTFNGWYVSYKNAKGVVKQKKVSSINAKAIKKYASDGVLKLEAKFTANKYSISYKKTAPAKNVKVNGKIKLNKDEKKLSFEGGVVKAHGTELSAEGYKLIGWTTVKNGTDVMIGVGEEKPVSELIPEKGKKIIFYPVWEAETKAE